MSDTSETGASVESGDGSAILTSEPENSAQRIAQHERSTAVGEVEFSEVPCENGNDPTLRLLVEVWGELPDSVKNQILLLADDAVAGVR